MTIIESHAGDNRTIKTIYFEYKTLLVQSLIKYTRYSDSVGPAELHTPACITRSFYPISIGFSVYREKDHIRVVWITLCR